jgi:hypothetical protein
MNKVEAVKLLQFELGHLWMIRTFLKHADEIQEDEGMLEVPRELFDAIRATEPSYLTGDWDRYLHKLKGKMTKLERVRDHYLAHYKDFSDHTNYAMAAVSLDGALRSIKTILDQFDPKT